MVEAARDTMARRYVEDRSSIFGPSGTLHCSGPTTDISRSDSATMRFMPDNVFNVSLGHDIRRFAECIRVPHPSPTFIDMFLSSSTVVLLCALFALVVSVHSQADPGNGDNSATCRTQSRFFDQVIDHTQQSSSHTFKQQYRLNTTTFKQGGPSMYTGRNVIDLSDLSSSLVLPVTRDGEPVMCRMCSLRHASCQLAHGYN